MSLDGEKQTPVIGAECCFSQETCNKMKRVPIGQTYINSHPCINIKLTPLLMPIRSNFHRFCHDQSVTNNSSVIIKSYRKAQSPDILCCTYIFFSVLLKTNSSHGVVYNISSIKFQKKGPQCKFEIEEKIKSLLFVHIIMIFFLLNVIGH